MDLMEAIAVISGLPRPIALRAPDCLCPVSDRRAELGFRVRLSGTECATVPPRGESFSHQFVQALLVVSQCLRHCRVDGKGAAALDQHRVFSGVARTSPSRLGVSERAAAWAMMRSSGDTFGSRMTPTKKSSGEISGLEAAVAMATFLSAVFLFGVPR